MGLGRQQRKVTLLRRACSTVAGPAGRVEESGDWDIGSTILLDDSVVKASFQPNNHVCVPECVGGEQDNALWQVAGYLEELRYQRYVARFIKQNPFRMGEGWNGVCIDSLES